MNTIDVYAPFNQKVIDSKNVNKISNKRFIDAISDAFIRKFEKSILNLIIMGQDVA